MKAILCLLFFLFASNLALQGQNLIAVQNGGVSNFFESLNEAVTSSESGDTLYLPRGVHFR